MSETPERLLTTAEAADVLGLSVKTLERRRVRGDGPRYLKLGTGRAGRVRYSRADIGAWLAAHRRAQTASLPAG